MIISDQNVVADNNWVKIQMIKYQRLDLVVDINVSETNVGRWKCMNGQILGARKIPAPDYYEQPTFGLW